MVLFVVIIYFQDQDEKELDEEGNDDSHFNDEHFGEVEREEGDQANGDADSQDNGDSDSDESDDVKVTIGEIKSGPQAYASLNIKVFLFFCYFILAFLFGALI